MSAVGGGRLLFYFWRLPRPASGLPLTLLFLPPVSGMQPRSPVTAGHLGSGAHPSSPLSPCGSAPHSPETLSLLGISVPELTELCTACTGFIRYVVDQVRGREGEGGAVVPEEGGTTAPKGGGGPD